MTLALQRVLVGLRPLALVAVALIAWELTARSALWSPIVFPSLVNIGHEFVLFVSRSDRLHRGLDLALPRARRASRWRRSWGSSSAC